MEQVYIIGTGMSPFGRHQDLTHAQLSRISVTEAMSRAGIEIADVDLAIYATVAQGFMANEHVVPGQFALRGMGFTDIPVFNVENACASSSTALNIARTYVATGQADVVLVFGTEKLYVPDRERRLALFNQPLDLAEARNYLEAYADEFIDVPAEFDTADADSVLMQFYGAQARMHMKRFGTRQEHLAAIASKNHMHSVHNPLAQYTDPMTVEDVLAGRMVSWPLTVPMCAPISDGSAAAIVCSGSFLKRQGSKAGVRILSSVMRTGTDRKAYDYENHVTRRTANLAYAEAGLGPDDISVAEVHDASAFGELIETEALGFCRFGEGGEMALRGETSIGGRIPVNPSGGLECRGHPLAATGLAQVHELFLQLTGQAGKRQVEGARIGLSQTGGGFIGVEEATSVVTILEKV